MNVATRPEPFKLVCESCGSLTIVLPVGPVAAAHETISCGRCGAPRGTLSMLRERSLRGGCALE